MYENLVIVAVIVLFLIFLALGQNIASLLFLFGILGIFLLDGWQTVGGFLENGPFYRVASYTLTTIPLYIIMSQFILHSGLVQEIFVIINRFTGGRSGILGSITIVVGGLMGAVSGSGAATAATLGQVATPQLVRYGYSKTLAAAIAAAGGSLAGLIPPSIILILYGSMTQVSIGALFIGAVFPGIILVIIFMILTQILLSFANKKRTEDNPYIKPEEEHISIGRTIFVISVGLTIFAIIFGGIYSGIFTPNEAGGVAAFVAFLTALFFKKVNLEFFRVTFTETIKVSGMILLIMIGAQIFGKFISLSLIPRKLVAALEPIIDMPLLIILLLGIFYFVLFMFLETAAAIVMSVPVTYPVAMAIGLDPIWFGVFICIISVLGLLTPPVGLSTFMVASVARVPIMELFKTTTLYAVVGMVIVIALITFIPDIVLWLPENMR